MRYFSLLLIILFSCAESTQQINTLKSGIYQGQIFQQGKVLPFNFEIKGIKKKPFMVIHNDSERLKVDEIVVNKDSIKITMNIFDTEIRARITEFGLEGVYEKNYSEDHILPFKAFLNKSQRFDLVSNEPVVNASGTYQVTFIEEDGKQYPAVAKFQQKDNNLTGTFLTETGDYRFLEGVVDGDSVKLSAFDGTHLFLFTAKIKGDSLVGGEFWHGKNTYETWGGKKDMDAKLRDAFEVTYLKPGYDKIEFSFPDLDSSMVSLEDQRFENKVVILQIFGTWCPNCMDETTYYSDWYRKNQSRGLEIVGLAYENKPDFNYAKKRVLKMKEKLNVPYDFLIAGTSDKEEASKTLPMLNQIISFPTSIFLDRKGNVRHIHTGFTGPGTGIAYEKWQEEFTKITEELLAE
ncbi:MAG: TlpA family protein disulfide reductase [bacterium]|nr:TlpA family protein disulfide reductase [bacterium]